MLDLVPYLFVRVLAAFFSILPLRAGLWVGRGLGLLGFHVLRIRRGVVLGNLRHVLGNTKTGAELRAIAREAYRNFGMSVIEMLRCAGRGFAGAGLTVDYPGVVRMRELQQAGKPMIGFVLHNGNFDLAAYATAAEGVEPQVVMKALESPRMSAWLVATRERNGLRMHLTRRGLFQDLEAMIRAGKLVAILPDQNARKNGVEVSFLGKPASIHKGPALLHLATGAQVFVGLIERHKDDPTRHRVHIFFPPPFQPTGDREKDLRACAQEMCDLGAGVILKDPTQYFWFHRLWGKEVAEGTAAGTSPARAPTAAAG